MQSNIEQMEQLTRRFAQTVCATLMDMVGIGFTIQEETFNREPFSRGSGTIAFIPFGGTIQGNCMLAFSTRVTRLLIAMYLKRSGTGEPDDWRIQFEELISEVLNVSVGRLMPYLEQEIEAVSYMPPILISGSVSFPRVASNRVAITGEPGDITCVLALNMANLRIAQTLKSLSDDLVKKTKMVFIDSLTGLKNRRYFDEVFSKLVKSSRSLGSRMSLLLIDIDNFKTFNDIHGHQTGDSVLSMTARAIIEGIREMDVACRYGGDEIVVILPDTPAGGARNIAERIQRALTSENAKLQDRIEALPDVTISIGIAQMNIDDSAEHFFRRADTALSAAKKNGRNCIEVFSLLSGQNGIR
jgi:diguanylate cyclase (GGDEF)-like protein